MAFQSDQLGVALGWKFQHAPGIFTVNGVLTAWPVSLGARPDDAAQAQIVNDYRAYVASPLSKDDEVQQVLDSVTGKALKAIVTVLIQKGVCTLAEVKAAYRSLP